MNPSMKRKADSTIPLPSSPDVEHALLGAVMVDDTAYDDVVDILPDHHMFYRNDSQAIWEAMRAVREKGGVIDQVSVVEALVASGGIDRAGGAHNIASLASNMATSSNVKYHSQIVLEDYKRRTLLQRLDKMRDMVYARQENIPTVLSCLDDFDPTTASSESCVSISESIEGTFDEIEEAFQNPGSVKGINTGISVLNKLLGGWQPGELVILAARPSTGKTAMALYSAMKCGKPVYFVSAEMSRRMLEHRLIGSYLGVPAHVLKSGALKFEEYMKLQDAERHLKNLEIYIEDRIIDSGAIAREARRLKREKDIGAIFIDYLQLLDPPSDGKANAFNREREIALISSRLKMLGKELDIPIIALSQLNREVERTSRRPILSDLRESGSLEQDADVVIFLHKDDEYPDYVECIVAKNRQGAIGSETLKFKKDIGEFQEIKVGGDG